MTDKTFLTGCCPHATCEHRFVYVTVEQVGEHFLEHLPFDADPETVGSAAITLMAHRDRQRPQPAD